MVRKLSILTALCCTIALTAARSDQKKIQGEIVCFGDSITFGAQVDGQSWVWYLQQRKLPGVDFINAGRSGRRAADTAELGPVVEKYPRAAYYLIFLGVNDLKDGTEPMVDGCVRHIRWMIGRVRETDPSARIVLLAPSDINTRKMSLINVRKKYNENTRRSLAELEKRDRRLAREEKTGFISLLKVVSPGNYADGLHPSRSGQQQIANAVWKHLKKQ